MIRSFKRPLRVLIICGCVLVSAFSCSAGIVLPGIFSSNMVLQQHAKAAIWGSASGPMVNITTSWDRKTYQIKPQAGGNWKVYVNTPAAGGPYQIVISDGQKIVLSNVLIGEVWVCSGQSNMEMPLRGNSSPILNASEIITHADNPNLRLYRVGRAATTTAVTDPKGQWEESTSESAREYSALAFQYGQILQQKLKVPVGLILSVVGGTMVEAWMSQESLKPFPEVQVPLTLEGVKEPFKQPAALFNGMISPIAGYTIKGFTWMQGESNRHEPALYGKLFPAMVADWRKRWNQGDVPFYYVQIAPYGSSDKTRSGILLREAQLNSMAIIPNSGMVPAIDVGMENDVHFMDKTTLARRLSYWALGQTYGIKGIQYRFPMYRSMSVEANKAVLTFDNAPYLTSYRKPLQLFEIAGADQKFYPAKAEIKANQVTVQSDQVSNPVAVRYAWKEWVVGELFNNDGLPASSFRTDKW